jgi:hypothetical protein
VAVTDMNDEFVIKYNKSCSPGAELRVGDVVAEIDQQVVLHKSYDEVKAILLEKSQSDQQYSVSFARARDVESDSDTDSNELEDRRPTLAHVNAASIPEGTCQPSVEAPLESNIADSSDSRYKLKNDTTIYLIE